MAPYQVVEQAVVVHQEALSGTQNITQLALFNEDGTPFSGATGPAGTGVPSGGSTSQVLAKTSATDFDTSWSTLSATAVSTVPATTGLDPASTNVEAALTELAARPSGGSGGGTFRYRTYPSRFVAPNVATVTNIAPYTDRLMYLPIDITVEQSWDALSFHVAASETGTSAQIGLVEDNPSFPGYPGDLIESVTVSLGATGYAVGLFGSAVTLAPGTYWLATVIAGPVSNLRIAVSSNSPQSGTLQTIYNRVNPPGVGDTLGWVGFGKTGETSIPATAPGSMLANQWFVPVPGLRAASW